MKPVAMFYLASQKRVIIDTVNLPYETQLPVMLYNFGLLYKLLYNDSN